VVERALGAQAADMKIFRTNYRNCFPGLLSDNPELPMEFTKTGFSDTNACIFPNVSYEKATKGKQMKSPAQIPAS
jgi:hypothetical protein